MTVWICRSCDYQSGNWLGRCPECRAWDTLDERAPATTAKRGATAGPEVLAYPEIPRQRHDRESTGIRELDRVLGGGLVAGAAILIGGEPGIGMPSNGFLTRFLGLVHEHGNLSTEDIVDDQPYGYGLRKMVQNRRGCREGVGRRGDRYRSH